MNRRLSTLVTALGGGLLLAHSIIASNQGPDLRKRDYSVIVDRNPFGLRPPPPPRTNAVVTPPPEEVLLTGITSLGDERAYFMSKASGKQAPEYYSLGVGEEKDSLEILEIDADAGSVRVRKAGVETVMTFSSNGVKPPPIAKPPVRGVAANSRVSVTRGRTTSSTSRIRTIPTRVVRPTTTRTLPSTIRTLPGSTGASRSSRNTTRRYAAEQDVLMMELQKVANPNVTYPPTPMAIR